MGLTDAAITLSEMRELNPFGCPTFAQKTRKGRPPPRTAIATERYEVQVAMAVITPRMRRHPKSVLLVSLPRRAKPARLGHPLSLPGPPARPILTWATRRQQK